MTASTQGSPGELPITKPPVLPVILCGGVGARLWPASRPGRSKPFLPLLGDRTPFQATIARALALSPDLLVVGGLADAGSIRSALEREPSRASAVVLLEPDARGTTAAIAAAVAWAEIEHPGAILVVMPADHHVPDPDAFAAAVGTAVAGASEGAIVTLGIAPTGPSVAMGYIRPQTQVGDLRAIAAFTEKPDKALARQLIEQGALWNAGIFVGRVERFAAELEATASDILAIARRAVAGATAIGNVRELADAFRTARVIAFDRAVMETTRHGAVVPAAIGWSDIGAWDAVLAASPQDGTGSSLVGDVGASGVRDVLVRAANGTRVAVVGVEGVAIIAEPGAVLVCGLDAAQSVGDVAEASSRARPLARYSDLNAAARDLGNWLSTAALPVWATLGVDETTGAFREGLTWTGDRYDPLRRTRVQARQVFVFASAGNQGRPGPWSAVARRGEAALRATARRPDGLFAGALALNGEAVDPEARLYEHAFVLLALSALGGVSEARAILAALDRFRHAAGGYREVGDAPFQANAHMHLFEAALAWEALDPSGGWRVLADEIAGLALDRFISTDTGALFEFFDSDWSVLTGDAALVEPGHQFEWAWLFADWGRRRTDPRGEAAARRLYAVGRLGVDAIRGVAVNTLNIDGSIRDAAARLWPQTEHLKAAIRLRQPSHALEAANAIARFLETPVRGVWRERMYPDGTFVEGPSPATSLYHLYLAICELERFADEAC